MEFDARPGNRHKLKSSYRPDICTRNYIQSRKDNEVKKHQFKTTAPNISVVTAERWQEKSFLEKKCFMPWLNLLLHIIAQQVSFSQIDYETKQLGSAVQFPQIQSERWLMQNPAEISWERWNGWTMALAPGHGGWQCAPMMAQRDDMMVVQLCSCCGGLLVVGCKAYISLWYISWCLWYIIYSVVSTKHFERLVASSEWVIFVQCASPEKLRARHLVWQIIVWHTQCGRSVW